jgi:hypothetical protein
VLFAHDHHHLQGRLSTPSAVETYLQAMMHASTVSDRAALNERCSNAKWQSKALVPLITNGSEPLLAVLHAPSIAVAAVVD